jgi:Uma2 family endonuclease
MTKRIHWDDRLQEISLASARIPIEPDDLLEMELPAGVSGYELVDGELVPVTPASLTHGRLILEVGYLLTSHIRKHKIVGELYSDSGFVLGLQRDPRRMRGPDIAFVSQKKLDQHGPADARFGRFAPDLAIEIDLASGRKPGGLQRIRDYLEAGVPLVWAIHPTTRSANVYRADGTTLELSEQDTLDGEDILPGFRLPLTDLFR